MSVTFGISCCFILLLIPICIHCNTTTFYQQAGGSKMKRRQVFREDVSPLLGGKVPSAALEWTRLMYNNLDSRGISIPNGFLPSPDRVHPSGVQSDEKRIVLFSNDSLEPYVESTYRMRSAVPTVTYSEGIEISRGLPQGMISPMENNGNGCDYGIAKRSNSPASAYSGTPPIIPNHPEVELGVNVFGEQPREFQTNFPNAPDGEKDTRLVLHVLPPSTTPPVMGHIDNYRKRLVDDILLSIIQQSPYILLTTFSLPTTKRKSRSKNKRKLTVKKILAQLLNHFHS